jgi:hypothetical protein
LDDGPENWSTAAALARRALPLLLAAAAAGAASAAHAEDPLDKRVLGVASRLLDEAKISYVYGGYQVGDSADCAACNTCLDEAKPKPSLRLKACPVCSRCSLDCSHFTAMVYKEAGAPYPYLATPTMLSSSAETLRRQYGLLDLDTDLGRAGPGDLLVYDGHVVLLERMRAPVAGLPRWRGDLVHATGGKDVKGGGQGVQRERFVDLSTFRGPLRRILRPAALLAPALPNKAAKLALPPPAAPAVAPVQRVQQGAPAPGKIRRVEKKPPAGG